MTPDKGIESLDFDIIRLRDWTHSKPLIQKKSTSNKVCGGISLESRSY